MVYKESSFTEAGKDIVVMDSPFGRLGLTVCYDLRFPELYEHLRFQQEAQVLPVPSAFTKITGHAHWEILLRSRAIETQCYVIAATQAGKHNEKRESYGDWLIIDPWGKIVARLPDPISTGIAIADIDFSLIDPVRTKMPIDKVLMALISMEASCRDCLDCKGDEHKMKHNIISFSPSITAEYIIPECNDALKPYLGKGWWFCVNLR